MTFQRFGSLLKVYRGTLHGKRVAVKKLMIDHAEGEQMLEELACAYVNDVT